MPYLDTVAQMMSYDVIAVGEAELEGGYAFIEDGFYLFGVEGGSTLYDTLQWDEAPRLLIKDGNATIHHACDHFIHARLVGESVLLKYERSKAEYELKLELFNNEIKKANNQLREFAVRFTPVYAKYLSVNNPSLENAYLAAMYSNFSNRPNWFASIKK